MPKKVFEQIGCPKKDLICLLNSMRDLNIPKKAKNIRCDTLILCGEKEKNNINMKSAIQLNDNIKYSQLKIIPNAGHQVNIDAPEELANIIIDFLSNKL